MKNEMPIHTFRIGADIIEIFDENDLAAMENELEKARIALAERRAAEKEERKNHLEDELNSYLLRYGNFKLNQVEEDGYVEEIQIYKECAIFISD